MKHLIVGAVAAVLLLGRRAEKGRPRPRKSPPSPPGASPSPRLAPARQPGKPVPQGLVQPASPKPVAQSAPPSGVAPSPAPPSIQQQPVRAPQKEAAQAPAPRAETESPEAGESEASAETDGASMDLAELERFDAAVLLFDKKIKEGVAQEEARAAALQEYADKGGSDPEMVNSLESLLTTPTGEST